MTICAAYAVPHPPLIIPGCGQGQERGIQATIAAYRNVAQRIAQHAPDTIIISSPHAPAYYDAFALCPDATYEGDFAEFRAPDEYVCAHIDTTLTAAIAQAAHEEGITIVQRSWAGASMDWATFIPLWFVNHYYQEYQVVASGLSGLSRAEHFEMGRSMARAAEQLGRNVVYIASGDLSHRLLADGPYGFAPEGPQLDEQITNAFQTGDLAVLLDIDDHLCEAGGECGVRSFVMMAGALSEEPYEAELLSYEGPFGVGYAVAAFEVLQKQEQ